MQCANVHADSYPHDLPAQKQRQIQDEAASLGTMIQAPTCKGRASSIPPI